MRKLIIGLIALSMMLLSNNVVFSFTNEPDNFRGIPWGTNIETLPDMQLVDTLSDREMYKRLDDKKNIGTAKINEIGYIFYKGNFQGVMIKFVGYLNYIDIKRIFFDSYGNGYSKNKYIDQYIWNGANLLMMLSYNKIRDTGSILYSYKPIDRQMELDKKDANKNAKDDL